MKRFIFFLTAWIIARTCFAGPGVKRDTTFHIIPEPVSVIAGPGHFTLKPDTRIVVAGEAYSLALRLSVMLRPYTGRLLPVQKGGAGHRANIIVLVLRSGPDTALGEEGYTLQVLPRRVVIAANDPQGLFYGIQTLRQLLPPPGSGPAAKGFSPEMPCVRIRDYPRFAWRGLMLDVSRHFFSKDFVEKYIDEMARYKFNVFHWHLSDDQGWRIQIKGLPELTRVGAWRVPRTGPWHTLPPPRPGEKATDGGYYTQADVREVVAYAKKRFVTVVPEIDVPAHSLALIAAYPALSCTGKQYAVNPGSRPQGEDNALCIAGDSTWLILDKIFTQVAALFPGEYIHAGGDEANAKFWMNDPRDLALMKKEGLKDGAQLQGYFEKRLQKLIASKGKKMIGWDEILGGGAPDSVAIMCWRGADKGVQAATQGHPVIMTPIWDTYLSRRQGSPYVEPEAPGLLRLKTCYGFDPVTDSAERGHVLGGEGCLWTEFVPGPRQAEYMTWPRAMALSEVFWSPQSRRDWPGFAARVQQQFPYLDAAGVKYARSIYDPIVTPVRGADDSLQVALSTEIPGLRIYYTFDGTDPDSFYPEYRDTPLSVPQGAVFLDVITYRGGLPAGRKLRCPLADLRKELEKTEKKAKKRAN